MPIQAAKNHVCVEFLPLNIIFYHRDHQKALPCAETRVLSRHWPSLVLRCDLEARRRVKKGKKQKYAKIRSFRRTPVRRQSSTRFCTRSPFTSISIGFEFQKDRLKDVGAAGVAFLAFPLTRNIPYTTTALAVM